MSSTAEGPDPTTDSPSTQAASAVPSRDPSNRPPPGAAGAGDDPEVTTTQPPRFTVNPTTSVTPPTTSVAPVQTTSNPPPAPTTTSAREAVTTRPSQPDPSPQQVTTPVNSPSPSPAAESPSPPPGSPTVVGGNSPTSLSSPLAGVNNIVSPPGATALAASSPLEVVSILAPTTLPDGTTTTIAIAPQPVLLTPSTSQGFVTATRSKGAQETDGVSSPTGTNGTGDHPLLTPSEKRGRDSAQITGIALGALVIILLALVFIPKFLRMFKNRDKDPSKADKWKPGQTGDRGIGYQKREKEDDEVSWFSGSTTHGDLSEDGGSMLDEKRGMRMRAPEGAGGDGSSFHLVQTLPYQPRPKPNIAGIGRRDTLRSIVQVPDDVPPPQAEFVAMPRTPTIIYSPPPEDADLAVFRQHPHLPSSAADFDTPARRNILTPLTFPTTPSSFPSTPASAHGHNPFSTPPLSGLYSSSEWQHILATPPDHRGADTPSPPPSVATRSISRAGGQAGRRRSTMPPSPNLSHCAPPSSYNETDSIYSSSDYRRSSIPSPSMTTFSSFQPPSQAQLLQNLRRQQQGESGIEDVDGIWPSEVRLEGLAKAAARLGGGASGRGLSGEEDGDDQEEIVR